MPQMKTWRFRVQLLLILALVGSAFAGTTGKISGTVTDGETGEPLAGVNVIVQGLGIGAATDAEGYYVIINIPPGQYEVRFSMIGYSVQNMTDVRVMIDLTTSLDVGLSTELIEGQSVTVVADRPIVQADVTYSQANISSEELDQLPVEEFEEVISLQAGVVNQGGGMHVRGGRSSEVAYMIDGIPVTDPYNATMSVEVENNAIQELQLISGTFNAEYGQAMSGIINIITREGDLQKYGGNISYRFGRYVSNDPDIYLGKLPHDMEIKDDLDVTKVDIFGLNGDVFTPAGRHDIQWSLNGPVPGLRGKTSFFLSGRYEDIKGRLYGVRRFNPNSFYWDADESRAVEYGELFSDFVDLGSDGCSDAFEDGMGGCSGSGNAPGSDPNHDNWDADFNPNGSEGNGQFDPGETGNGIWDGGDRITALHDHIWYNRAEDFWFLDENQDGLYNAGDEFIIHFPDEHIEYDDLDGDGRLTGEWYFDENGDGDWTGSRADNAVVPLYTSQEFNLQSKLTHALSSSMKLSLNILYGNSESRNSTDTQWKYSPDGRPTSYTDNMNIGLILQHSISPETFYTIKGSVLGNFGRQYYTDIYTYQDSDEDGIISDDERSEGNRNHWGGRFFRNLFSWNEFDMPTATAYDSLALGDYLNDNKVLNASTGYRYNLGGISTYHYYRMTRTQLLKWDLTSQVNKVHQIQAGVQYKHHSIFRREFSILYDPAQGIDVPIVQTPDVANTTVYFDEMTVNPFEFALYLQDKIELVDMIVNAGLRYEIFDPDGVILNDPSDPNPLSPRKLINKFHDLNGDGLIDSAENIAGNAVSDEERLAYWFRDATRKNQFSPRLAIAYPITDRGVLHFSYGHFFQIPPFNYLYTNNEFEVPEGGSIASATIGNADLEPQKTVQYEVGFQQQFGENVGVDVTGFYKDISNLLGSRILSTYTGDIYGQYVNRDYGNVKGLTIALNRRMSDGFSAKLDYTFSIAEGNASDPNSAFYDAQANKEPEKQLVYLDWDQRHTLNGSVMFMLPFDIYTSFICEYGSGFPYTPTVPNLGTTFENSDRKPATFNVDARLSKTMVFDGWELAFTMNIYNLLDIRNELSVYGDTGSAEYSLIPTYTPEYSGWAYNTLAEYLYRPGYFSAPRQIRIGLSTTF